MAGLELLNRHRVWRKTEFALCPGQANFEPTNQRTSLRTTGVICDRS